MRHETVSTESEAQFERMCRELGWGFVPVPRSNQKGVKTPDYDVCVGGNMLVVEIKEIDKSDLESHSLNIQGPAVSGFSQSGRLSLRNKIARAAPQVKARSQGKQPSIIVVYDRENPQSRLKASPQNFLAAMYGWPILRFRTLSRRKIAHVQTDFSPEKKLTPTSNTSISAMALLWLRPDGQLALDVFHNVHAKCPLDPVLIHHSRVSQFTIQPFKRNFKYWVPIDVDA
jgi:hypothetical protein